MPQLIVLQSNKTIQLFVEAFCRDYQKIYLNVALKCCKFCILLFKKSETLTFNFFGEWKTNKKHHKNDNLLNYHFRLGNSKFSCIFKAVLLQKWCGFVKKYWLFEKFRKRVLIFRNSKLQIVRKFRNLKLEILLIPDSAPDFESV